MSILCPCCKNIVGNKGKTLFIEQNYFVNINGKKNCSFENDHVCCICLTNENTEWIKMNGCTCIYPPGHKECLSTYFYINNHLFVFSFVHDYFVFCVCSMHGFANEKKTPIFHALILEI